MGDHKTGRPSNNSGTPSSTTSSQSTVTTTTTNTTTNNNNAENSTPITTSSSTSTPKPTPIPNNNTQSKKTIRDLTGETLSTISTTINDHLIVARYGTFATVSFLTVYGLAQTPLFFRYGKVRDVPSEWFRERRRFHGRIVAVMENGVSGGGDGNGWNSRWMGSGVGSGGGGGGGGSEGGYDRGSRDTRSNNHTTAINDETSQERPIVCKIRHLSPMGRLMNRSLFDFVTRNSPKDVTKNLIDVEIAGICAPPLYTNTESFHQTQQKDFLRNLATKRTSVVCTLLSRRIPTTSTLDSSFSSSSSSSYHHHENDNDTDPTIHQTAICDISYRPSPIFQHPFRHDLATTLVSRGLASVVPSTSGSYAHVPYTKVVDGSSSLEAKREDARRMERLEAEEFRAVGERVGMWEREEVRGSRKELVEEVEWERNVGWMGRIWRWVTRGG